MKKLQLTKRLSEQEFRALLLANKENQIAIKTTYVSGGWHDVEFTAQRCGYTISRFICDQEVAAGKFGEFYRLTKKA